MLPEGLKLQPARIQKRGETRAIPIRLHTQNADGHLQIGKLLGWLPVTIKSVFHADGNALGRKGDLHVVYQPQSTVRAGIQEYRHSRTYQCNANIAPNFFCAIPKEHKLPKRRQTIHLP